MNRKEKTQRVKRQIIHALEEREGLVIKVRRAHKKDCFDVEIGDCKDMDMDSCKGATGLSNFDLKECLKEIKNEMLSLRC